MTAIRQPRHRAPKDDGYSSFLAHVVIWGLIVLLGALYAIALVWGVDAVDSLP